MKIHTPLFILGLLVFITPAVGFAQIYEQIILAAYGIAIMLLVSTNNVLETIKNKKNNNEQVLSQSKETEDTETTQGNQNSDYEKNKTL